MRFAWAPTTPAISAAAEATINHSAIATVTAFISAAAIRVGMINSVELPSCMQGHGCWIGRKCRVAVVDGSGDHEMSCSILCKIVLDPAVVDHDADHHCASASDDNE